MHSREHPGTGAYVAFREGRRLEFAVVRGESKGRLELTTAGRKKTRVSSSRLVYCWPPQETGLVDWLAELQGRADAVDVATLWELAREEGVIFSVAQLADWLFGECDTTDCAVLELALQTEGLHFARHNHHWELRPAEVVVKLQSQRESEAEQARRRHHFLSRLQRALAGDVCVPHTDSWERRTIDAFERFAVEGESVDSDCRRTVFDWLDRAGAGRSLAISKAYTVGLAFSRFDGQHENLDLRREARFADFDESVECAVEACVRNGPRSLPRFEDWTGSPTLTIDDPWTREVDDALSWRRLGRGRSELAVHIADPTRWFDPGSLPDETARTRRQTIYLPDQKLPMLPPALSEVAASLNVGEERQALSFIFEVDASRTLVRTRVTPSRIRVDRRMSYEEVDASLARQQSSLSELFQVLEALAEERGRRAAPAIQLTEVEVRVVNGNPLLFPREPGSRARLGVTEAMVRAGETAAATLSTAGMPGLFRHQAGPQNELPGVSSLSGEGEAWVYARRLRLMLRRGTLNIEQGKHYGLGAEGYAQATSPLRRYVDLVNLRQLHAVLSGADGISPEILCRFVAEGEVHERKIRALERRADRYWKLEAIRRAGKSPLEAVVLTLDPRPRVGLLETRLEWDVRDVGTAEEGEILTLLPVAVDPRGDLLTLRYVKIRDR